MKNLICLVIVSVTTTLLSGCLLTRPFHNQVIATTDSSFQVEAWIAEESSGIEVRCSDFRSNTFYTVALFSKRLPEFQTGWSDSMGIHVDYMNATIKLPEFCWKETGGGRYHATLRVEDGGCHLGEPPCTTFFNVNQAGYACTIDSYWASNRWLSWLSNSCYRKNPATNEREKTLTLIASRL